MVTYCAAYGCNVSSYRDKGRRFFRFPRDITRCKKWMQACDRLDLAERNIEMLHKSFFICDLHFKPEDIMVKNLKWWVIPSLNLSPRPPSPLSVSTQTEQSVGKDYIITKEESCQTEDVTSIKNSQTEQSVSIGKDYIIKEELCQTEDVILIKHPTTQFDLLSIPSTSMAIQTTQELPANTPRKRKLSCKLGKEPKLRRILENKKQCSLSQKKESAMSPQLCKVIKLKNQLKRNSRGKKYDKEYKLFALDLYFACPLAYKILSNTLSLPSEKTLRGMKIKIGTKLYPNVLKCLERKIHYLKESEKYCVICADEISFKTNLFYQINEDEIVGFHEIDGIQTTELAAKGFVIMARGIFSNWKQQLGYCFLAQSYKYNFKEVNEWLDDAISKMLEIGFKVLAFVSDQGTNFLNLARERKVTAEKSYFVIDEKKIYYIFDVPSLVVSVRNNLQKYNFKFRDTDGTKMTAKWEDIEKFYREYSKTAYRLAPKLTESHINPNNFEICNVKYATQVFSSTVAAAMHSLVEWGRLDEKSIGTVKLIEMMDKIFDILNSSAVKNTNKYKSALSLEPFQTKLLEQFKQFLTNVTILDKNNKRVTNSIKCRNSLNSFKISIQSIKCLAQELQSEGYRFIFTRRLNKEALEHFFGVIQQQGGKCRKPTPIQFNRAFNKSFMVNIMKHSENTSIADDLDRLLMNIDSFDTSPNPFQALENEASIKGAVTVAVGTIDYRFGLPKRDAFVYVCRYLLRKCFEMHKCEAITRMVKKSEEEVTRVVQKSEEVTRMVRKSEEVTRMVQKSEKVQHNVFTNNKAFSENKTLIKNPPESFVNYIKALDTRFKNFFGRNTLNLVGNEILNELREISFDDCCDCFPNMYLKKLFIRFRIFNIVKFNNRLFKNKSFKNKYLSVSSI